MALVRVLVVSAAGDTAQGAVEIREVYAARARAELGAADAKCPGADTVSWRGALLAEIAVVKGMPGPAEAAGGAALTGADGEAIEKALETLGWNSETAFFTLSRPLADADPSRRAARLRLQIEAVDPVVVVALDACAAEDLAAAFSSEAIVPGAPRDVLGRRFVALTAFEESLSDQKRKQQSWRELQAVKPPGPVY